MRKKIYPIRIQNFEKIHKEDYVYIDKTALVYQMVKSGSYYFLSPNREVEEGFIKFLMPYCRRSAPANRGKTLCPSLRSRPAPPVQDRCELQ